MKFPMQIVNNYQSLTIVTNTHIPGVTWDVDLPLNLILIRKKTTHKPEQSPHKAWGYKYKTMKKRKHIRLDCSRAI